MRSKKRWMMAAALCLVVLGLSRCDGSVWHEKITIVVETPSGEVRAHSVQRVRVGGADLVMGRAVASRRGEAVVLELSGQDGPRYLFGLLQDGWRAKTIYKQERNWYTGIADLDDLPPKVLTQTQYPMLVTFDDVAIPETVKRIDPANLAATFGPGYALKSITLEITEDAVTMGRMEKFGFFKKLRTQASLSGLKSFDKGKPDPVNYLNNKAFVRETPK